MPTTTLTQLSNSRPFSVAVDSRKTRIAIRVGYGPTNHHFLILLDALNRFPHIEAYAVLPAKEFHGAHEWFTKRFSERPLITYEDQETDRLSWFDMVMLPESSYDTYSEFPKELVKIGLPHGVDIPFRKTMMIYGGGSIFDYILSPKKESDAVETSEYEDLHHPSFRNHSRGHVCQIPFGFPKLDEFMEAAERNNRDHMSSIAYHIALLSIEEEKSLKIIEPTLLTLLEKFPEKRIVFRPYKYDHDHKIIRRCLEIGKNHPNFYLSTAESYTEDYSTAIAMVCHRRYSEHLFSLATGRPIFLCYPDNEPTISDDPAVVSCGLSELVNQIRTHATSGRGTSTEIIEHCTRLGFHNPGQSVEYFARNIQYIVHDRPHPDWKYFTLDSEKEPVDERIYSAIHVISGEPSNIYLKFIYDKHPSHHEFLLFLADSYSRMQVLVDYYSKLSLKCYQKLVSIQGISPKLEAIATRWWSEKGPTLLRNVFDNENIELKNPLNALDAIDEKFIRTLPDPVNHGAWHPNPFREYETLIDLDTLQTVQAPINLAVYGGRRLAERYCDHGQNASYIEMIVDPDVSFNNRKIGSHLVQSTDKLLTTEAPVLISSYSHLFASFVELKARLPGRQLFAICRDRHIFDFLPLLR